MGISKEAQSFLKWELVKEFEYHGFSELETTMLEIFPRKRRLNETLERIPLLREIAGTILIKGRREQ